MSLLWEDFRMTFVFVDIPDARPHQVSLPLCIPITPITARIAAVIIQLSLFYLMSSPLSFRKLQKLRGCSYLFCCLDPPSPCSNFLQVLSEPLSRNWMAGPRADLGSSQEEPRKGRARGLRMSCQGTRTSGFSLMTAVFFKDKSLP